MQFKKQFVDKSCYDLSLERIRYAYKMFDHIAVSFSGGKDSTAVLNMTIQVARELGKLPVHAIFFDEEAIHPTTIDYVERVRNNPDVKLDWYCVEIKHVNACSKKENHWFCWDKLKENLWTRPLPGGAITDHPFFKKGMDMPVFADYLFEDIKGNVCLFTGMRATESLRRYYLVSRRINDNWLKKEGVRNVVKGHPIYDWIEEDVWRAPFMFKWDYNTTYDIYNKLGIPLSKQRVCPPFGEEPLRGLWMYAQAFPELWHKMLYRVPGVATAWRYANTSLYGMKLAGTKPEEISWQEYMKTVISGIEVNSDKVHVVKLINQLIRRHNKKSILPLDETEADPISGISWMFLCQIALKRDLKGRTQGSVMAKADGTLKKMNLTLQQAIDKFATPTYKEIFHHKMKGKL